MAENKFIKHLKGTETAGSVLEIKNQGTPATFGNMPAGTSNPNTVYADARGDATAVLKGTDVWKLNSSTLDLASRVYGDGRDFTDTYTAFGSSLWVNATHTFDSAKIFGANTKWVLKLCGANLLSAVADTIDFSLIIKFGSTPLVTKTFTVAEHANNFCQQFVIDFDEWTQNVIKATSGDTMTIQLLCGDSTASATIYNGMTTLTALQRRVDGDVVASDTSTFDDLEQGLDNKVSKTGDTMSGALTFTNATGAGGIFGYTNGVVFFYMNGDTRTPLAALNTVGFAPYIDNTMILGGADLRWKELHATTAYLSAISNGYYDLAVPMTTANDTLALKSEVNGKVSIDGSSTMTGVLKMRATSSFQCAIAPFWDGVGFYKLNNDDSVTLIASIETPDGFVPWETNTYNIGSSLKKWKNLYLGGKLFVSTINNGGDLAVPAVSGTLATKADVDLAANSGRMITDQGVWYAKMDALGTIPSSAEVEGRNYADFTQVDGNNDPIIVIYTYTSGAWVQTETITPPSAYDGYVPITSKIWDIPEQTGQQGGRILWNHTSKQFTPYPQIVSFDSVEITGNSTVEMPQNPSDDNIANVGFVKSTIGGARNIGDIFLTMRADNALNGAVECNGATYNTTDFVGSGNIGGLLADGKVPYVSMATYATEISTKGWCDKFGWDGTGNVQFKVPTLSAYIWQKLQLGIKGSIGQSTASGFGKYFVAQQTSFTQQTVPSSGGYSVTVTNDQTIPGASVDTTDAVSDQRVMVQLAVSATDEAVEICTSVLADVAELKYDYVVDFQAPTAANNYTWYRKYKSGWVEQGGQATTNSSNPCAIDLPVEMADTYYDINIMGETITDGYSNATWQVMPVSTATSPKSTTRFYGQSSITGYNLPFYWQVSGMAA